MNRFVHWSVALAPWVVSWVLGYVIVHGLLAQLEMQTGLDAALQGVLRNVRAAGGLTRQTALALQPMADTASTLTGMNLRLRQTRADLAEMNGTLVRLQDRQGDLLAGLEKLNDHTRGAEAELASVATQNTALLETTGALTGQTAGQATALAELLGLTGDATQGLGTLNRRFRFIK